MRAGRFRSSPARAGAGCVLWRDCGRTGSAGCHAARDGVGEVARSRATSGEWSRVATGVDGSAVTCRDRSPTATELGRSNPTPRDRLHGGAAPAGASALPAAVRRTMNHGPGKRLALRRTKAGFHEHDRLRAGSATGAPRFSRRIGGDSPSHDSWFVELAAPRTPGDRCRAPGASPPPRFPRLGRGRGELALDDRP
jgi:hypothetical protein